MKWILIGVLLGGGTPMVRVPMAVEFNSVEACIGAHEKVREVLKTKSTWSEEMLAPTWLTLICVPKG